MNETHNQTWLRPLATAAFIAMLGMTAYETAKQLLFPHVPLWQSHMMTIFVTAVACCASTFLMLKHQANLIKATRQAENMYRNLVENAVEGIFRTTPEGAYLSVNPALARMYGYDTPGALMLAVEDIGHQV